VQANLYTFLCVDEKSLPGTQKVAEGMELGMLYKPSIFSVLDFNS
jgi:hypothetical protein